MNRGQMYPHVILRSLSIQFPFDRKWPKFEIPLNSRLQIYPDGKNLYNTTLFNNESIFNILFYSAVYKTENPCQYSND